MPTHEIRPELVSFTPQEQKLLKYICEVGLDVWVLRALVEKSTGIPWGSLQTISNSLRQKGVVINGRKWRYSQKGPNCAFLAESETSP